MKAALLVSLWLAVGTLCVSATPTLTGSMDGVMGMDTATGAIALNTTLSVDAAWDETLTLGMTLTADELGAQTFDTRAAVALDALSLSGTATFDVPASSFTDAAFALTAPLLDADLTVSAAVEPGALGAQMALAATGDSVIRSLTIGFNLDAFGRIQTTSCTLPFPTLKPASVYHLMPATQPLTHASALIVLDGVNSP